MGMITGSAVVFIRDILMSEVPLIFRKDICIGLCGGLVYFICFRMEFSAVLIQILSALSVILIRILAVKYHISLPVLKGNDDETPTKML